MTDIRPVIVKVGGSLYDLPDLGPRLLRFLARPEARPAIVVPGGGRLVDMIRQLDHLHGLGEEASHWLALDALAIAARFLARLVPGSELAVDLATASRCWQQGRVAILDARRFAETDEGRPGALPHTWRVTSDAIAARLAAACRARRLILLKSVTIPEPVNWIEASRQGLVDEYIPEVLKHCDGVEVQAINLRTWSGCVMDWRDG